MEKTMVTMVIDEVRTVLQRLQDGYKARDMEKLGQLPPAEPVACT